MLYLERDICVVKYPQYMDLYCDFRAISIHELFNKSVHLLQLLGL